MSHSLALIKRASDRDIRRSGALVVLLGSKVGH